MVEFAQSCRLSYSFIWFVFVVRIESYFVVPLWSCQTIKRIDRVSRAIISWPRTVCRWWYWGPHFRISDTTAPYSISEGVQYIQCWQDRSAHRLCQIIYFVSVKKRNKVMLDQHLFQSVHTSTTRSFLCKILALRCRSETEAVVHRCIVYEIWMKGEPLKR